MEDNRYYGIYRGICVDNQDPENITRIKLKVPQILHTNITNWAYPCLPVIVNGDHGYLETDGLSSGDTNTPNTGNAASYPSGTHNHTIAHTHNIYLTPHHKLPNINQGVWVMFEGGDPNFPVWMGVY
jgi:hypothetical protein